MTPIFLIIFTSLKNFFPFPRRDAAQLNGETLRNAGAFSGPLQLLDIRAAAHVLGFSPPFLKVRKQIECHADWIGKQTVELLRQKPVAGMSSQSPSRPVASFLHAWQMLIAQHTKGL
jgi:hypothetical protein